MFNKVARPVETAREPHDAPFRILHLQQDRADSGSFRPDARLMLSSALRTSGFWAGLEAADAHTLILLLSFLSPNGHCTPALSQMADALHCSSAQARTRLLCLMKRGWNGQSLAVLLPRQDGNDAFAPGPHLLAQEHPPLVQERSAEPRSLTAGREKVIAHSRSQYAHPRAEVEAGIAARMGWGPPAFDADTPNVAQAKQDLYQKMTNVGVTQEQVLDVLARFSPAQVGRQVDWLPFRNAKNPARFLLAAIEGNYDPPVTMKRQAETILTDKAFKPPSDLPGLGEDVSDQKEHTGAKDGDHTPLHDAKGSADPPDEPELPEGALSNAD